MGDHIYAINLNFKFQKIFGLWRDANESRGYKLYRLMFHLVFSFVFLGSIVIGSVTADNVDDFLSETLFIILTEAALAVKTVYGFLNFADIAKLHRRAVAKRFQPCTNEERQTLDKLLKQINAYFIIYLLWASFGIFSNLSCLFNDQYKLPMFPWLLGIPHGKHLPYNYGFLVFYQVTGLFFHCIFTVIVDSQVGYLLTVAYLQLDFLLRRFRAISHDERLFRKEFKQHIEHFNEITEFVKEIERIYSIPVFSQFCASAITICAIAYKMSSLNPVTDSLTIITMLLYLLSMMNQIFLPCYFGNQVTLKSEQLTDALYSSEWIHMSFKNRKDIMMMMIRSERPITVKAGGFFHYNLSAFSSTLNTAYSLFCVLKSERV